MILDMVSEIEEIDFDEENLNYDSEFESKEEEEVNDEKEFKFEVGEWLETIEEVPEPPLTIPAESIAIWNTIEKVEFIEIYEEEKWLLTREDIFKNELLKVPSE